MGKKIIVSGQEIELPAGVTEDAIWHVGVRAGWDPVGNCFRDIRGGYTTAEKISAALSNPRKVYGGLVRAKVIQTPWSDALDDYDRAIAGLTTQELTDISKGLKDHADPMPRVISNEMKRAQHFFWQEGDIAQSFYVPMELMLQEIYVESPSQEIAELLTLAYGAEIGLDLRYHLYEMYLCMAVFGTVYPVEIWDTEGESPIPTNIIPLNPLDVRVGRRQSRDNFSLNLPAPGGKWTEEHRTQIQPIETALLPKWSEGFRQDKALQINPELCRPIRWHALNFDLYAHPPLASMFRPITTRVLVEEARRAIIEGYRQQLWIMQVGTPEFRGTQGEVVHLTTQLEAMRGLRTGTLIWNGNLTAEVLTPDALDALMNDTLWLSLTLDIMRRRGISLSLVSGESPSKGAGSGSVEIDIRMLMMRLAFDRWKLLRWVAPITRRIMEIDAKNFWQRKAAHKELGQTRVMIKPTPEEAKELIQNVLEPLVAIGKVSDHTLMRAANLDWDTQLREKQIEQPYRELFAAPLTFTQRAEGPGGETTDTSSQRRPQDSTDKRKVTRQLEASVLGQEADEKNGRAKKLYQEWLALAWALAAYEAEHADVAATQLKALIARYMVRAGGLGYSVLGGEGKLDREWMKRGVRYMQGYVAGLEEDWGSMTPNRLRWRLGLYAQEGMRIGYVMGAQQAAKELYDVVFWQRVLHESKAGPCVQCQEDSFHLHSIDEPFFEYHPQGVCGAQTLAFFRMDGQEPALVEVNIPIIWGEWGD